MWWRHLCLGNNSYTTGGTHTSYLTGFTGCDSIVELCKAANFDVGEDENVNEKEVLTDEIAN